jgi:hypothetical protein
VPVRLCSLLTVFCFALFCFVLFCFVFFNGFFFSTACLARSGIHSSMAQRTTRVTTTAAPIAVAPGPPLSTQLAPGLRSITVEGPASKQPAKQTQQPQQQQLRVLAPPADVTSNPPHLRPGQQRHSNDSLAQVAEEYAEDFHSASSDDDSSPQSPSVLVT